MAADDGWSARANDALSVSLVAPSDAEDGLETLASFRPRFTYPIFGEEEQIFGYKGLDIKLRYSASDMRPNLTISYRKKFPPLGGAEPNDIEALLKESSLPDVAFQKLSLFNQAIRKTSPDWTPPGEKIATLETGTDTTYEVWRGTLADPAVRQLVSRIQILVPLFIEAGTPLRLDDPADHERWTVFFLYQNRPSGDSKPSRCPYMFAGYATVYRFFLFQPPVAHGDAAAEIRRKLQITVLNSKRMPTAGEMKAMSELLAELETWADLDAETIRTTGVHTTLQAIGQTARALPGDDELRLKARAQALFEKYEKRIQAGPPPQEDGSDSTVPDLTQLPSVDSFDAANFSCRSRISQFLITPPFQKKGLGPRLYEVIFREYAERHPATVEITVEDPNEAFDDMRDIADLKYLRARPEFRALHIDTSVIIPEATSATFAPANIVDPQAWQAVRRKFKIAPRQFARVLEMDLMSRLASAVRPGIPNTGSVGGAVTLVTAAAAKASMPGDATSNNDRSSVRKGTPEQIYERRLWRLMVKQRLYRFNKEALGEFELDERITKLDETLAGLEFDYARLLAKAERQEQAEKEERERQANDHQAEAKGGVKEKAGAANSAKRKLDKVDEVDAGGSNAGDGDQGPSDTTRKRARTEEMPDA